jgi:hypothetical protein
MTQTPTTFDPPSIFDSKGRFVEWPDSVLERAPRHIQESYDAVHEDADELVNIDAEIAATEATLFAKVSELRSVESEIARAPRLTQQDLLRAVQETQRRYGG